MLAVKARQHRGLSLIELMVGLTIGLIVVAAASATWLGTYRHQRALQLSMRLRHDVDTAVDVIQRELQRAGYWADAEQGLAPGANPYNAMSSSSPSNITFHYAKDHNNQVDSNETLGFRLRSAGLDFQLGSGNWQALTDRDSTDVTAFTLQVTQTAYPAAQACSRPCPATSTVPCPPALIRRHAVLHIEAQARADNTIRHRVDQTIALRNDTLNGQCPAPI